MIRLRPLSYTDTDVILMCFSIDSPDSLDNILEKWSPEVAQYCPEVPVLLVGRSTLKIKVSHLLISSIVTLVVGNKKDLRNDPATLRELSKTKQDPVTTDQGRAMAEKINAFKYLECSAKNNDGVREVLETATRAALMAERTKKRICDIL